jgi:signal transduction histidine kinase
VKGQGSLVRRLFVLAGVWAVLVFVAGGFALTHLYRSTVFRDVDDRLDGAVRALLATAEIGEDGSVTIAAPPPDPRYGQVLSGRYWAVIAADGSNALLAGSRSLWDGVLDLPEPRLRRARENPGRMGFSDGVGPDGEPLRVRIEAVRFEPSGLEAFVAAAVDRRDAERDVRSFALAASWTLAVFAFALIAAVAVQVRWALAPLFRMRESLAQVREGARERLDEDAPREIAPLVNELNALLDHNRDVVNRARAHAGNLAHALKTPISILLNESGRAEGGLADVVRKQTEAMSRQVDHHLKRASAAARAQSFAARTDVRAVVDDLARTLPRMYPDRDVTLEAACPEGLVFRGERQDLVELAGNLLDNAYKWARSRIRLEARALDGDRMELVVDDDGPGLGEKEREEVVRRGARLDESAPGSGLGLSIVDDLARAYGGGLALEEADLGGLRARLTLPSAPKRR